MQPLDLYTSTHNSSGLCALLDRTDTVSARESIKKRQGTPVSETELCLQLAELEAGLRQLTVAVLKLRAGDDRRDILNGIGNLGQRINDMKHVARELRSSGQVANSQALSPLPLSDQATAGKDSDTAAENRLTALTQRERQIMRLVSEGLSNKEIGRRLNIGDGTIKVHLHNIFQKLEIRNRTVLAALATSAASEARERVGGLAGDDGEFDG
jgi:DNA-binding NarL/FixJ family response regulator